MLPLYAARLADLGQGGQGAAPDWDHLDAAAACARLGLIIAEPVPILLADGQRNVRRG